MNSIKHTQIDRHEFTWLIMSVNRYHMGLSPGLGLTGFELAKFNTVIIPSFCVTGSFHLSLIVIPLKQSMVTKILVTEGDPPDLRLYTA